MQRFLREPNSAQRPEPMRPGTKRNRSTPEPGNRHSGARPESSACDVDDAASAESRGSIPHAQPATAAPRTSQNPVRTRCNASPRSHSCSCIKPALIRSFCRSAISTRVTIALMFICCLFPLSAGKPVVRSTFFCPFWGMPRGAASHLPVLIHRAARRTARCPSILTMEPCCSLSVRPNWIPTRHELADNRRTPARWGHSRSARRHNSL
jgi:hypothetical protein